MRQGGCVVAMPVVLAMGVLSAAYAAQLSWREGLQEEEDAPVLVPLQGGDDETRQEQPVVSASSATISRRTPALVPAQS